MVAVYYMALKLIGQREHGKGSLKDHEEEDLLTMYQQNKHWPGLIGASIVQFTLVMVVRKILYDNEQHQPQVNQQ